MKTVKFSAATLNTMLKFRCGASIGPTGTLTRGRVLERYYNICNENKVLAPQITKEQEKIAHDISTLFEEQKFFMYLCSAGPGTGKTTTIGYAMSLLFNLDHTRNINIMEVNSVTSASVPTNMVIALGVTHSTGLNLRRSIIAGSEGIDCSVIRNSRDPLRHNINIMTMRRFVLMAGNHENELAFISDINARGVSALSSFSKVSMILVDEFQTLSTDMTLLLIMVAKTLNIPLCAFGDPKQNMFNVSRECSMMKMWSIPVERSYFSRVELTTTFRMSKRLTKITNTITKELYSSKFADLIAGRQEVAEDLSDEPYTLVKLYNSKLQNDWKMAESQLQNMCRDVRTLFVNGYNVGIICDSLGNNDLSSYMANLMIQFFVSRNLPISRVKDSNFTSIKSIKFVEIYNSPGHEFDVTYMVTTKSFTEANRNYFYTALTRSRHTSHVRFIHPQVLYRMYQPLRNMDIEHFQFNGFEFTFEELKWDQSVRPCDWLVSSSLCKPNNETYNNLRIGLAVNGCKCGDTRSCDVNDIKLIYGKNAQYQLVDINEWMCPPEPKLIKTSSNGSDRYVVGVQKITPNAVHTVESLMHGIVAAIVYGRRYAIIYGDINVKRIDTTKIDTDAFMWLVKQLQVIDFSLRDNGLFVDTEFDNQQIDEICIINYETPHNSVFRKVGSSKFKSCIKTVIDQIEVDGMVYYYKSSRDCELIDAPAQFDVGTCLEELSDSGYYNTTSTSMDLQTLYSITCGIPKDDLLHTAAYDAVLLAEIATKLKV